MRDTWHCLTPVVPKGLYRDRHRGQEIEIPPMGSVPFLRPNARESWWAQAGLTREEFDALVVREEPRMRASWFGHCIEVPILDQPMPRRVGREGDPVRRRAA